MKPTIKKPYHFSKVGMNEVHGLTAVLRNLMKPVQRSIKDRVYWNDCALEDAEYTSRDGFIPHSDNCGGIQLRLVIPSCEQYEFSFLEFGGCDPEYCTCHTGTNPECELDIDGHKDAALRIWLKFEGIEDGVMSFYLYCGGGNGDAPYFRTKYESDIFETSFTAKTLKQVDSNGRKAIKKLLEKIK